MSQIKDNIKTKQNKMIKDFSEQSWSLEEDFQLQSLVEKGLKHISQLDRFSRTKELTLSFDWSSIAMQILGRSARDCKERFLTVMSPETDKRPWSVEERELLKILNETLGSDVEKLSNFFPGRREYNFVSIHEKNEDIKSKTSWADEFVDEMLKETNAIDFNVSETLPEIPADFDEIRSEIDPVLECSNSYYLDEILEDFFFPLPLLQRQQSILSY